MIFLDHAAYSHPKPPQVYAEVERALHRPFSADRGSGSGPAVETAAVLAAARAEVATVFGVDDPERVVFTLNGTDALNTALHGLLGAGDHVVTSDVEHNAVARPLTHLQMKGQIALTRIDSDDEGRLDPAAIEKALRHRTRLVVIGHGNSALGTVQPLEEFARITTAHGVKLVVDASHTAGVLPIDVDEWGLAAVATSGHTGLMGPAGTGVLALGRNVRVRPLRMGDSGADSAPTTQPLELPEALEAGMWNLPGLVGLQAGAHFVLEKGVSTIREHETMLIKRFIGAIGLDERFKLFAARGDLPRTGTVSFSLSGFSPAQVVEAMMRRHGITLAAGLHGSPGVHRRLGTLPGGTVRASVGWYTSADEIDRAVAALREIAEVGVNEALRGSETPRGEAAGAS